MRLIIQRVIDASVTVAGAPIAKIGPGLCVFLAAAKEDTESDAEYLASRIAELRIFEDETGKMNLSVAQRGGEILVVSEFTLYADCAKGRRPSFSQAAAPAEAERLYNIFVEKLRRSGLKVGTGKFQSHMEVAIVNEGPVTLILDSR